ncbi:MAG: PA2169 family four-helix-bundle protein [Sphingobacteriales bacterium]|nr:MAG: PA2169 family four-helix-bundle protein [Sphingobacteriales bacterium]
MLAADLHAEVLNDLIRINNDRILGYEKAIAETAQLDIDLDVLFKEMIQESRHFREELAEQVALLDQPIAKDTTLSGKVYRAWMDLKASITGTDRKAILDSCAFGEDAWRKAYETVLETHPELPVASRQLLTRQYNTEQQSADLIKKYRDAHAALV